MGKSFCRHVFRTQASPSAQSFRASQLASKNAAKAEYQVETTGDGESQLEMLRRLELDDAAHIELHEHCRARGIRFLSSPFDLESAYLLIDRLALRRGTLLRNPCRWEARRSAVLDGRLNLWRSRR